jgi:hypothetical protein
VRDDDGVAVGVDRRLHARGAHLAVVRTAPHGPPAGRNAIWTLPPLTHVATALPLAASAKLMFDESVVAIGSGFPNVPSAARVTEVSVPSAAPTS